MASRKSVGQVKRARSATTEAEIRKLASNQSPYVRAAVAQNEKTPAGVLTNLAKERSAPDVAIAALMNPSLPLATRFEVAKHSRNRDVLAAAVAGAPRLGRATLNSIIVSRGEELKELAQQQDASDREHHLLAAEAKHADTMPTRLAQLARTGIVKVQAAVAQNEKTPHSTLEGLARNSEPSVRIRVAVNESTPLAVREYLVREDSDPKVVTEAIARAQPKERESLKRLAATSSQHPHIRNRWQSLAKKVQQAQPKKDAPKERLCPTPTKKSYDTRGQALGAAFGTAVDFEKAARAYRCPCGAYHVTTKLRKVRKKPS